MITTNMRLKTIKNILQIYIMENIKCITDKNKLTEGLFGGVILFLSATKIY